MQSGESCIESISTLGTSGSFISGGLEYKYHEYKLTNPSESLDFEFTVTRGFTTNARAILIGAGGGGGWDGSGNYGKGGGGGAGEVIDTHNLTLVPATYILHVGGVGAPADADAPIFRTFNGSDGDYTQILGGIYTNPLRAQGGDGGYGDANDLGTFLHGGNSGNGFTGGLNAGSLVAGGGAGAAGNGVNGTPDKGGNGGSGVTITLPFTSTIWGSTSKAVGGGGGGSAWLDDDIGAGLDGGGRGAREDNVSAQSADRYTGAGGGGGESGAYTPPNGIGTTGGDGVIIIYYPVGNCDVPYSDSITLSENSTEYSTCYEGVSTTLYHNINESPLELGSTLYRDAPLTIPVSSSYFSTGSNWYQITGSDGIINDTGSCPPLEYSFFNENTASDYTVNYNLGISMEVIPALSLNVWVKNIQLTVPFSTTRLALQGDSPAGVFGIVNDQVGAPPNTTNVSGIYGFYNNYEAKTLPVFNEPRYTPDWHMNTFTWEEVSGDMKLYIDGQLYGSASYTSSIELGNNIVLLSNPGNSNRIILVGEGSMTTSLLTSSSISDLFESTKTRYGY